MNHFRAFLATAAFFCCGPAHAVDASMSVRTDVLPEAARRSYAQNYADIALALCIAQAYAFDRDAKADAVSSAAGIDEFSNFDLEAGHEAMSSLIAHYLARDYPSIHGPKIRLDLMKCIDMAHGAELAAQVRRFVPAPGRSYQDDNPPGKR